MRTIATFLLLSLYFCVNSACVQDSDCVDAEDMFCQHAPNMCGVGSNGTCFVVPDFCPANWKPVCGCDGITYPNPCEAAQAKQNIATLAECDVVVTCMNNTDCNQTGLFCIKITSCEDTGLCNKIPPTCNSDVFPVCGCDGKTYISECLANSEGISVASEGPCPVEPSCTIRSDCPEFFNCKKPVGVCSESYPGTCAPEPESCTTQLDPICGCDGKTYINGCFAQKVGILMLNVGICNTTRECSLNSDCESEDQFCLKDVGWCDDDNVVGLCVERPLECFRTDNLVCGCDKVTYDSDCHAFSAGESIAHTDSC